MSRLWPWSRTPEPTSKLTPEALRELADAIEARERAQAGDGSAEYMSDMTEEEYEAHKHDEVDGWKEFSDKVNGL